MGDDAGVPLIRPRAGPRPPSPAGEGIQNKCPMRHRIGHSYFMQFYFAVLYPSGLWLCQFQLWAHISSMPYCASQPSSRLALEGSHQHSAMSPGRRGSMT